MAFRRCSSAFGTPPGWGAALQAALFLRARGISNPFELGVLTPSEFHPSSDGLQNAALRRTIWTAPRAMIDAPVPGNYLVHGRASLAKTSMTKAILAHSAQVQNSGKLELRGNYTTPATLERSAHRTVFARSDPMP